MRELEELIMVEFIFRNYSIMKSFFTKKSQQFPFHYRKRGKGMFNVTPILSLIDGSRGIYIYGMLYTRI